MPRPLTSRRSAGSSGNTSTGSDSTWRSRRSTPNWPACPATTRGRGLARALILRLLDEARGLGYREVRLDTLPMMGDAQALYLVLGFIDIPAYYDTPIAGTRFMALVL